MNNWPRTDYEMWRKSANDREISEKEVDEKTERILASLGMTKNNPRIFSLWLKLCGRERV